MRPSRGRAYWRKLVRAYERSGVRQRAFRKQHGVSVGTFQHWLYRIRAENRAAGLCTALVQVDVSKPASEDAQLEAGLPSGVVLHFPSRTDPVYVGALVAAVEAARC